MLADGGGGGVYGCGVCDASGTEKAAGAEPEELCDGGGGDADGTPKGCGAVSGADGIPKGCGAVSGVDGISKGCGAVSGADGIPETRSVGAPALDISVVL